MIAVRRDVGKSWFYSGEMRMWANRLAKHVRLYYEIIAPEEYRFARGRLPEANEWDEIKDAYSRDRSA